MAPVCPSGMRVPQGRHAESALVAALAVDHSCAHDHTAHDCRPRPRTYGRDDRDTTDLPGLGRRRLDTLRACIGRRQGDRRSERRRGRGRPRAPGVVRRPGPPAGPRRHPRLAAHGHDRAEHQHHRPRRSVEAVPATRPLLHPRARARLCTGRRRRSPADSSPSRIRMRSTGRGPFWKRWAPSGTSMTSPQPPRSS